MKKFRADPFPTDTPSSYPSKEARELYAAILKLKSVDEAAKFFRDLLTMPEITEFANRWQVVKLLYQGTSYTTIAKKLGVSTATITRVAHWLKNGLGGYKALADRIFPTRFKDSDVPDSYHRTGRYRGLKKMRVM